MKKQVTSDVLMVRPANFAFNAETAENNFYQQKDERKPEQTNEIAVKEFDGFVNQLERKGVNVIVVEDTPEPVKNDAIFPNNWFSTHYDGKLVLYPMYSKNRRLERRDDIHEILTNKGFKINETISFVDYEAKEQYLEGTGSLILDRINDIAYACRSERTHPEVLAKFGKKLGFKVVDFDATQEINGQESPIYHTNVMMHLGAEIVVVCMDSLPDTNEKLNLQKILKKTNKSIVNITPQQKFSFAGNMLEVANKNGDRFTVMSQTALNSLKTSQILDIEKSTEIIAVEIPTIEKLGGGSARCMLAEIFLPKA